MVLFKIGTTDITGWLDSKKYVLNKQPVYEEWTDGNGIEHRVKTRDRISGSIVAGFSSQSDLTTFLTLLGNSITADGYFAVTAYVNNTDTSETINAFLDYTATAKWDFTNSRQWHVLTIKVTQR